MRMLVKRHGAAMALVCHCGELLVRLSRLLRPCHVTGKVRLCSVVEFRWSATIVLHYTFIVLLLRYHNAAMLLSVCCRDATTMLQSCFCSAVMVLL